MPVDRESGDSGIYKPRRLVQAEKNSRKSTQRGRAASWEILNFEFPKSQYFKMVWV